MRLAAKYVLKIIGNYLFPSDGAWTLNEYAD